jgi:hypothetical protein
MHSGCVSGSKKGGVQLGLAFVLCAKNMHFFDTSVRRFGKINSYYLRYSKRGCGRVVVVIVVRRRRMASSVALLLPLSLAFVQSIVDTIRRGRGARGPRRIGWFGLQGRAVLRGGGQGVAGEGREGERMPLFGQQRLQYDEKVIGSD